MPNVGSLKPPSEPKRQGEEGEGKEPGDNGNGPGAKGGGGDNRGRHPFIQGLLKTLPEPETNWAVEGRAKWLQAAANIFDLMYKGSGEIAILVKEDESGKKT
jgi:hypothetical protein